MNIHIKLLRSQHGLSLEQLADRTGLTKSYLSKVERGLSTPSISAALKIAGALHVEVPRLFETQATDDLVSVTHKADRLRVASGERLIEIMAQGMPGKQMQPFLIEPPDTFADGPQPHEHSGEEFLFVLAGRVEMEFPGHIETLSQGDSVYFRAEIRHRLRRVGKATARALVVIAKS